MDRERLIKASKDFTIKTIFRIIFSTGSLISYGTLYVGLLRTNEVRHSQQITPDLLTVSHNQETAAMVVGGIIAAGVLEELRTRWIERSVGRQSSNQKFISPASF